MRKGDDLMTLIISEVSRFGIVMVADSAVTEEYPESWTLNSGVPAPPTVRTGAQKIIPVGAISAAIGVWGFGTIGTPNNPCAMIPIDVFLQDFADSIGQGTSIEEVGNELADIVNDRIVVGTARGGFHLAGYIQGGDMQFPALYHIHTGHRASPPHDPLRLYRDYPFGMYSNQGLSLEDTEAIDRWVRDLQTGVFTLRNGAYDVYAYFSPYLHNLVERMRREINFVCPDYRGFQSELEARCAFLKLQVKTICEFYRMSNRLNVIAMPISCIAISPEGMRFEPIVI
jgi:hypothetical protein